MDLPITDISYNWEPYNMWSLVTSFTYHVFKIHSSGSLCIRTLLFFIAEYYSVIQTYHISLTHSAIYPLKIKQIPIYIRRVNYLALHWTGHLLIPSMIHSRLSLHTCNGNDPVGGTSQMWQWVAEPCSISHPAQETHQDHLPMHCFTVWEVFSQTHTAYIVAPSTRNCAISTSDFP